MSNTITLLWFPGEGTKGSRSYFALEGLEVEDSETKQMSVAKLRPGIVLGMFKDAEDLELDISQIVNAKRLDREFPKISLASYLVSKEVSISDFLLASRDWIVDNQETEDTGVSSPDNHAANLLASLTFGEIPTNAVDILETVEAYLTEEKITELLKSVQKKMDSNGRYEDGSIRPRKPKTPKVKA